MKKIKFLQATPLAELEENFPSPAINNLPEAFKSMPAFDNGEKRLEDSNILNQTVKRCIPFLDAISAGYVIKTPADLWVTIENGLPLIRWSVTTQVLGTHDNRQIPEEMIPEDCHKTPFKLINDFGIQTPAGYSTMFLPILNMPNIPLVALSGIVDTDTYVAPVNFPFFLKKGVVGKIPAGTPIAQAIPFKREQWKSEVVKTPPNFFDKIKLRLGRSMEFAYKKIFWVRKIYR